MLIGMSEAGKRVEMTREGVARALRSAGIPLSRVANALAVEETDLAEFMQTRVGRKPGAGRPRKTKKAETNVPTGRD
jgi:hypothetical protein